MNSLEERKKVNSIIYSTLIGKAYYVRSESTYVLYVRRYSWSTVLPLHYYNAFGPVVKYNIIYMCKTAENPFPP